VNVRHVCSRLHKLIGSAFCRDAGGAMTAQPTDGMVPYGDMRAATADRERAVDVLKAAFAEGRLDQTEYADRVGLVYSSRTYAELAALTADLPVGPLGAVPALPARPTLDQHMSSLIPVLDARPEPQATRPTNHMAIAAFIFGLLAYVTSGVTAPLAIGLALVAAIRIRRTGELGIGLAVSAAVLAVLQLIIFQSYWIGI
jgi:hypothetical protein